MHINLRAIWFLLVLALVFNSSLAKDSKKSLGKVRLNSSNSSSPSNKISRLSKSATSNKESSSAPNYSIFNNLKEAWGTFTSSSKASKNAATSQKETKSSNQLPSNCRPLLKSLQGRELELVKCINSHLPKAEVTKMGTKSRCSRIEAVTAFQSHKVLKWTNLTLITQIMWYQHLELRVLCESYRGPVSAVVYFSRHPSQLANNTGCNLLSINETLLAEIEQFHNGLESKESTCGLDLLVVQEVVEDVEPERLFPINTLRNYGRLQARTPLIMMVDPSLVPGSGFWGRPSDQNPAIPPPESNKSVLIVPSFKVDSLKRAKSMIKWGKRRTANYTGAEFEPFGSSSLEPQSTLRTWLDSRMPYTVPYQRVKAPWVMASRFQYPWHDERFRGYGLSRECHVQVLHYYNYTLQVHPQAFLFQRPHLAQPGAHEYREGHMKFITHDKAYKSTLYGINHQLFSRVESEMLLEVYSPIMDRSTRECRDSLTWWQGRKEFG